MSKRTEHIETLEGRGVLTLAGRALPVEYAVMCFQNYEGDTPTQQSAEGWLAGLASRDIRSAMEARALLDLALADGRLAKIAFKNAQGDFVVAELIAAKPAAAED